MRVLREVAVFVKIRVVLLSVFSAVTGYVVAVGGIPIILGVFMVGLFLLAAGSAGLNECQEWKLDLLMERTRNRPLPSGGMKLVVGLVISLVLILFGLSVLTVVFGLLPGLLGLGTVIFYNGIYTYFKRVTAFAAIPGAVVGTLPPVIGWTAAGGEVVSPALLGLVFFFYIWQVPHFWLLLGIHSGEYERAGFPSLGKVFTASQLARVTFTWVLAAACAVMLFPLFGIFRHGVSLIILPILTVLLGIRSLPLIRVRATENTESFRARVPIFRRVFMSINLFAFLIMLILIIDHGVKL
jgi:protoheme IX farnesyltransferase